MKNLFGFLVVLILIMGSLPAHVLAVENAQSEREFDEKHYHMDGPMVIEVILRTNYADGVSTEQSIQKTVWSMEDFWSEYAGWQLVNQDHGKMVFERKIEDISPAMKENGHFGLTDDGVLTIFEGKPDEQKVIQTFFQIDVGKVESSRLKELAEGIPIESWYNFEDMLHTFYKIKKSQPVR
ncbi:BofC C-terminal domain-containing protein [Alkalihalobacillus sp. CinArs1]|uniref:BofC C-terminal domain-containing protein n=1 Tax=Alkalihalobacillus sp. CinArs1 TaxID=2995314 RepID=UPI0022DE6B9E|nr:BofC C-terminal domain-containing protein [Alkalihalobacillus sp. CinArs1]